MIEVKATQYDKSSAVFSSTKQTEDLAVSKITCQFMHYVISSHTSLFIWNQGCLSQTTLQHNVLSCSSLGQDLQPTVDDHFSITVPFQMPLQTSVLLRSDIQLFWNEGVSEQNLPCTVHLGTICLCSTALLALCFTERRTLTSTQLEMPLNPSHCQNHSSLSVICLPQPKSQRQLRLSKNTAGRFQQKISKECQSVLKLSWCHILGHPHKCRSQNCSVCPAHHCCATGWMWGQLKSSSTPWVTGVNGSSLQYTSVYWVFVPFILWFCPEATTNNPPKAAPAVCSSAQESSQTQWIKKWQRPE